MGIMFVQCDKQQSQKTIKNRTVWARLKTTEILQFDMGIIFVQCDKQQSQKTIKNRTVWARL